MDGIEVVVISHCSIEHIEDGELCRVPSHVLYLNEDGEWNPAPQASINKPWVRVRDGYRREPLFPTRFDLIPTIDDYVRSKIQELDGLQAQVSLIFRYYNNWCYGIGYSKEILGKPMTLPEFYAEISQVIANL